MTSAAAEADSAALRAEVARIIAERDITSLYQPIVDLRSGDLVGCEVLSRGPEGSPLASAPALFGAAAAVGLLAELDLVCRILGFARAVEAGGDPGLVFVNVEPGLGQNLSMNSELAEILATLPFQAVVELTERALTHQPARLLTYGDNVRARGNLIAIDDLGADPHSLALVPLIKPDILKLDLAVVQGTSLSAGVTAAAAWEYADRTGAIVLGEGIETKAHLARANALGAIWGQGYLFGRPGPYADVISRRCAAAVAVPWSGARRDTAIAPAPGEPRRISRLMMTVLSDQLEIAARGLGPHGVLVASVESADVLSPRLLDRYSTIAERAAFVGIIGAGVSAHPCSGVHGGDVAANDALAGRWSVAVLGPHFGAALTAVPDPEEEGSYRAVYTLDPVYAARVAEQLTRLLIPQASVAPPTLPVMPVDTTLVDIWPAISNLLRQPGVRAVAVGDDGLFVEAPAGLADLIRSGVEGISMVGAVVAEQRELVARTWIQASSAGGGGSGGAEVRTLDGQNAWLHFIDVRDDYGVRLAVLIPHDGEDVTPGAAAPAGDDQQRSEVAVDSSRSGSMRKDERAVILEADSEVCTMLGYSATDLEGLRTLELIHPDDRDVALTSWINMLSHPGRSGRVRLRHRRADGSYLWCEVANHNALTDPRKRHVLSQLTDVDAEVVAQQELAAQQRTLRTLAETLTIGIALVDATGHVAYANAAMLAFTGQPGCEDISDLLRTVHTADLRQSRQAYHRAVNEATPGRVTVRVTPPGGVEPLLVRLDISPTGDGGAVVCAADVTEETRLHEQLEHQATRDALTGCWNRPAVLSSLEAAVAPPGAGLDRRRGDRSGRLESGVAVLYVDLDGFKAVNDELGHAAGDLTLIQAAERLRAAVRDTDDIGRLGGDEFLLLCRDVADDGAARVLAEQVRASLAVGVSIPASVGVAWTSVPVNADTLVARADSDMYADKVARRAVAGLGAPLPR